uniref:Uncharacterized protein n=1 Tax=Coturnix japonica TaxID=93934 RepID=A0A8C2T304_COTJA
MKVGKALSDPQPHPHAHCPHPSVPHPHGSSALLLFWRRISESPGFSQPPRLPPETSYGKLRPVRAAPPPPTQQHHRRPAEKIEDVEITLV